MSRSTKIKAVVIIGMTLLACVIDVVLFNSKVSVSMITTSFIAILLFSLFVKIPNGKEKQNAGNT